jgi:hypothetical protein
MRIHASSSHAAICRSFERVSIASRHACATRGQSAFFRSAFQTPTARSGSSSRRIPAMVS